MYFFDDLLHRVARSSFSQKTAGVSEARARLTASFTQSRMARL
jgi:hypothetical protein